MLPDYLSATEFVLRETRQLSDDERKHELEVLAALPKCLRRATAWIVVPWLLGFVIWWAFPSFSQTDWFYGLAPSWVIASLLATGFGVITYDDTKGGVASAHRLLANPHIEVWEFVPPLGDEEHFSDCPARIEVIAGTHEIWSEQWSEDEEDAEAQLSDSKSS